jgi:uncharacterized protein YpuA (DUF1002 family)
MTQDVEKPRIANATITTGIEDCEIDITPEMIVAGELAFAEFDYRFEGEAEAVVRIFRAMVAARPKQQDQA